MEIKIDEQKILKEILEFDGDLHERIKEKVRNRLVDNLVDKIETKYIDQKWNGDKVIADAVLDDLKEQQTDLVKRILKEFYDSYRYKENNLEILKKLKEFIDVN